MSGRWDILDREGDHTASSFPPFRVDRADRSPCQEESGQMPDSLRGLPVEGRITKHHDRRERLRKKCIPHSSRALDHEENWGN
ncbi:MAG: hypothetical protein D6795_17435 [Deltaproteobacteria bacterium]|nr:MAG: hypothetical protein D6795_17435 [Deltaproteobacteria bacterium]